ncbi:MAG: DUF4097 family beta strand repeat-containing protein [Planctomycetota bacterium]
MGKLPHSGDPSALAPTFTHTQSFLPMRQLTISACAALLIAPLAGCMSFKASVSRTDQINHPSPAQLVEILSKNGAISVQGAAVDEIQIEAKITAYGSTEDEAEDVLDGAEVELIEDDGKLTVRLTSESPQHTSASFKVLMPVELACQIETRNGGISVQDIDAPLVAKTRNGSVNVQDVGDTIDIDTSNGAVSVDSQTPANVRIVTSNGTVRFGGSLIGQDNMLQTSNGRVVFELRDTPALVTAKTNNGGIRMDGERIKSGNTTMVGSTDSSASEPAAVTIKTSNGEIIIKNETDAMVGEAA